VSIFGTVSDMLLADKTAFVVRRVQSMSLHGSHILLSAIVYMFMVILSVVNKSHIMD